MHVVKLGREDTASVHLDALRGLAALSVLLMHFRQLFFVPYKDAAPGFALHLLFAVTAFGHQAVVIFFVLSGFFISAAVLQRWSEQRWSWQDYLVSRLTRLYVVLIPALLLCAMWDRLGMYLSHNADLYTRPLLRFGLTQVSSQSSWTVFLGNLGFLQEIVVRPFGSDSPLWSLSYEWWFYILFPLSLTAFRSSGRERLYAALGATALFGAIGPQLRRYFLIWMMGAAIHWFGQGSQRRAFWSAPATLIAAIAGFLMSLAVALVEMPLGGDIYWTDFLLGATFTLLVYCLVQRKRVSKHGPYRQIATVLAGSSYTLYLVHLPFLFFWKAWLFNDTLWQPDFRHFLYSVVGIGITLIYAHMLAQMTEIKTDQVRRKVAYWLSRRSRVVDLAVAATLLG